MIKRQNKYRKLKIFHFASMIKDFKKSQNILIFGNFGAMNLGDESILAGEVAEIKNVSPNAKITVVSRYPSFVKKIHDGLINGVALRQPITLLKAILKANIIIVGGGGLFNKNRNQLSGYVYQSYIMILFIFLPKILNKKVYLLGIGIYENMNKVLLNIAKLLFGFVDLITVRDFHSHKLLNDLKIKNKIFKDNSYLMDTNNSPKDLMKVLGKNYSAKDLNIGLSLRTPFTPEKTKSLVDAVSSFMIKNKKATFWFYVLDNHLGRQNDSIINNLVINRVKKHNLKIRKVSNSFHPNQIFPSFKLMDKFITMRLHSMIFADRLLIPFVGISYDVKCSDFLQSVGKTNLLMDDKLTKELSKF